MTIIPCDICLHPIEAADVRSVVVPESVSITGDNLMNCPMVHNKTYQLCPDCTVVVKNAITQALRSLVQRENELLKAMLEMVST